MDLFNYIVKTFPLLFCILESERIKIREKKRQGEREGERERGKERKRERKK